MAVFVALCAPLLFFLINRQGGNTASYFSRCGPDYRLFLLCCCAAALIACSAATMALVYSARTRERGHPINGVTYSWAAFSGSVAVLASSPFLNLRFAPCFVTPALYSLVATTASLAALHTIWRLPELKRVPVFTLSEIAGIAEKEEIDLEPYFEEMLNTIKAEVAGMRADREGMQ